MAKKCWKLLLLCLLLSLQVVAHEGGCPVVKIQVERLPDLNIPRASHQLFCAGGEYVVAGGHTDGFVPTPTAEYFKDGQWHTMQMVYNHDFACSVTLKSGKVLLAGGSKEPLGIGQTFMAELYDPVAHSFRGFGCLDQKRAGASATEMPDGNVIIAGNWYHDDSIELFDGDTSFSHVKGSSIPRSAPFIFLTAHDDAIIFGAFSTKGDSLHSSIADRLKAPPISIPLFQRWHPFGCSMHRNEQSFIGDMAQNRYDYLVPLRDSTGQVAIAKVHNGDVSLLPTACPVPTTTQWGAIEYFSTIVADQKRGRAYLVGGNADFRSKRQNGARLFVLRIDYANASEQHPAPLTLYHTDPLPILPDYTPLLTPDGQLLLAGGLTTANSNFSPSAHAYLLPVGDGQPAAAQIPCQPRACRGGSSPSWPPSVPPSSPSLSTFSSSAAAPPSPHHKPPPPSTINHQPLISLNPPPSALKLRLLPPFRLLQPCCSPPPPSSWSASTSSCNKSGSISTASSKSATSQKNYTFTGTPSLPASTRRPAPHSHNTSTTFAYSMPCASCGKSPTRKYPPSGWSQDSVASKHFSKPSEPSPASRQKSGFHR